MPLITCPECGHPKLSTLAEACPQCGASMSKILEQRERNTMQSSIDSVPNVPKGVRGPTSQIIEIARETSKQGKSKEDIIAATKSIAAIKSKIDCNQMKREFLEQGVIVLSDSDLDLIDELTEEERIGIREIYLQGCAKFNRELLEVFPVFECLEKLDASYSRASIGYQRGIKINVRFLSLRGCSGICRGDLNLTDQFFPCVQIVHLDDNPQLDAMELFAFMFELRYQLREFSFLGCQTSRDCRQALREVCSAGELDAERITLIGDW